MEKQETSKICCVTGGSGYLGYWLVKKLLEKGYTVHATIRNLDDESKVGFLKSLPGAATNLVLFQSDIYNPHEFKHAIQGCEFVFHVATPMQTTDTQSSQEIIKAAISGVRSIAESCLQSPAVKRIIYTASVLGASPLTKDGFNVNSCTYTVSKTLAEKEALRYNGEANTNGGKLEVLSLACGLVGGETLLSFVPSSMAVMISQLIGNLSTFVALEYMEQLLGSIPIVHIDDVCEAHVLMGEEKEGIAWDKSKLVKMGFVYKYDMENILDDSVKCGRRLAVVVSLNC
ncbi:1-acyl-sn-glycerol-3-phosphate acyltransferase delta isoform 1 [Hibiscus syriacus]|uniref:1-acyl-sn-glycerol-3-phosphate acyltransferase delta isoform 1 n=1 Tax=Hibiscus syriacus TaxID=106335 RepID=A0A6A2X172_HIBSY|nr:1-acyl-sn-glycerol-3-phosphate acyltransferase delta isoform 1 [Hibiscus syriacus]